MYIHVHTARNTHGPQREKGGGGAREREDGGTVGGGGGGKEGGGRDRRMGRIGRGKGDWGRGR